MTETVINLYQDKQGYLYLHRQGDKIVYIRLEELAIRMDGRTGAKFKEMVEDLSTNQSTSLSVSTSPISTVKKTIDDPATRLVAQYNDGTYRIFFRPPTKAARAYLDLLPRQDDPKLDATIEMNKEK